MSVIDDIKARVGIVELATRYASQLWPRGRTSVCRCLCGHNTDRHPSFTLYPAQSRFYCYACSRGGDVINLVELADPGIAGLAEGHRRKEAVRALACWYGIVNHGTRSERKVTPRFEPYSAVESVITEDVRVVLEAATAHFESVLTRQDDVMRYLIQSRGLTATTIQRLRLGYSDGRLARALSARGVDLGLAARLGLLTPNGEKLRGRVIFPVLDAAGAPVWMLGRAFAAGAEPKYDGLPDGLVHKQPMWIGQAKRGIVLVEGAFDAAALVQWHIHAEWLVVALLGTGHRKVMERLSETHSGADVVLLLDQDKAGKQAALNVATELLACGFHPRIVIDADRHTQVESRLANQPSRTTTSNGSQQQALQQKMRQELALVEAIDARQLSHWVNWGGAVKDPGDLLMLGEPGRRLLQQAMASAGTR